MLLSKEDLEKELDLETTDVEIGDGKFVRMVEMSASDYIDTFNSSDDDEDDNKSDWMASIIAASIIDEDGNRMFTADEVWKISNSKPAIFSKLCNAVKELNGLEKNSDAGQ